MPSLPPLSHADQRTLALLLFIAALLLLLWLTGPVGPGLLSVALVLLADRSQVL